jgi:hypothetical protein
VDVLVLGPIEVHDERGVLDLGPPEQRAMLALLAVHADALVPVDTLVEELWDGRPPRQAEAGPQTYVSNLRRLLEPGRASRAATVRVVLHPHLGPGHAAAGALVGTGNLDAEPQVWTAPAGTTAPPSDPAPAGTTPLPWRPAPVDWRAAADRGERLGTPDLALVGATAGRCRRRPGPSSASPTASSSSCRAGRRHPRPALDRCTSPSTRMPSDSAARTT